MGQNDTFIIELLLRNYADLNFKEQKTGFNPITMACHLNTEQDALLIIKLLCSHRYYEGQTRIIDVNFKDLIGNTCLHHAALTNKLSVCQYLIQDQEADTSIVNQEGLLPIDLTSTKEVELFLSKYMQKGSKPNPNRNTTKPEKGGFFNNLKKKMKKSGAGGDEMDDLFSEITKTRESAPNMGRRSILIKNSTTN